MKLAKLIPKFLKPILKPLYVEALMVYRRIKYRPKTRNELYEYWKDPWDGFNLPQDYFNGKEKSLFLLEIIKKYVSTDAKIIEIGCNVGRNLIYLFSGGFKNLEGIEISKKAVKLLKKSFPELANCTKIY